MKDIRCTGDGKAISKLGGCVRRLTLGDQFTLETLYYGILKCVDFDTEHMYYFEAGTGSGRKRYFAEEMEDERCAADVSLAELSLYEGQKMKYLYDFGDEWRLPSMPDKVFVKYLLKACC